MYLPYSPIAKPHALFIPALWDRVQSIPDVPLPGTKRIHSTAHAIPLALIGVLYIP